MPLLLSLILAACASENHLVDHSEADISAPDVSAPEDPGPHAPWVSGQDALHGGPAVIEDAEDEPEIAEEILDGDLQISELMSRVGDDNNRLCSVQDDHPSCEYVEVLSLSDRWLDPAGYTLADENGMIDLGDLGLIPPRERRLICAAETAEIPGDDPTPCDLMWARTPTTFALRNTGETVALVDPQGAAVTAWTYPGGADERVSWQWNGAEGFCPTPIIGSDPWVGPGGSYIGTPGEAGPPCP